MAKIKKKTTKKTKSRPLVKSDDVPVSKKHLDLTKQEIKSEITSLRLEMKAGFSQIDSRFTSIESKFTSIEGRFTDIDGKFTGMDAKFASLDAKLSGMMALLEEQNSRNRYVLDGYTSLNDKQESTEARVKELEKKVFGKEQN